MLLEEQRLLHEDIERLEQAIADCLHDEPRNDRERLNRDHQIANFLTRIHDQSKKLYSIYKNQDKERDSEIQSLSTGDPFEAFYKQFNEIKSFHKQYPNEPVENLERIYKKDVNAGGMVIYSLFTGEEGYGRFFDLTALHRQYLNLPGIKGTRRITYLQYLNSFDTFTSTKRTDKMKDEYFQYIGALSNYLEGFIRKVRPLDDLDLFFTSIDRDFDTKWGQGQIEGWEEITTEASNGSNALTLAESIWCDDCQKGFKNENVYQHHLTQKKHLKAVELRKSGADSSTNAVDQSIVSKLKEKAVSEREYRIQRLVGAMQTERSDTQVNVERRQGMTERERQAELEILLAEQDNQMQASLAEADSESDGEEKFYNPLKLPIGWDGKPIPFWLYKLHGLGVEYECEICGNFVYMGRRAFEKHFTEQRHIYGLKCLGVTNTSLFREITKIEDAMKLWEKVQKDKKKEKITVDNVVQMEDAEGNVMPEKVYNDLRKQGLL